MWNHSVFSKNRDRLIEHDALTELFNATVDMADKRGLLSGEHFSVDGTLIKAWASHKSVRRKDGRVTTGHLKTGAAIHMSPRSGNSQLSCGGDRVIP